MIAEDFPSAKFGGRPRKVAIYAVVNVILYVLCQGCTWRALPGDFRHFQKTGIINYLCRCGKKLRVFPMW
ncbi:transposase [Anabaena sp. CS-542/02]|uniref:transposase n=1 Tax=Anabaena sp. CS-542/02 TaxID=3021719 RepID=UPI003FA45FDD